MRAAVWQVLRLHAMAVTTCVLASRRIESRPWEHQQDGEEPSTFSERYVASVPPRAAGELHPPITKSGRRARSKRISLRRSSAAVCASLRMPRSMTVRRPAEAIRIGATAARLVSLSVCGIRDRRISAELAQQHDGIRATERVCPV